MEGYWKARRNLPYYALLRSWVEKLGAGASILDVGCYDTPVATWGTFERRYTVDVRHHPGLPGVTSVVADFLQWTPPEPMTLVTCCQVLEHFPDALVQTFGRKLLLTSVEHVIVSVPFRWPSGDEPAHLQDPIDREKLVWMMGGALPVETEVVADNKRHARLLARWKVL